MSLQITHRTVGFRITVDTMMTDSPETEDVDLKEIKMEECEEKSKKSQNKKKKNKKQKKANQKRSDSDEQSIVNGVEEDNKCDDEEEEEVDCDDDDVESSKSTAIVDKTTEGIKTETAVVGIKQDEEELEDIPVSSPDDDKEVTPTTDSHNQTQPTSGRFTDSAKKMGSQFVQRASGTVKATSDALHKVTNMSENEDKEDPERKEDVESGGDDHDTSSDGGKNVSSSDRLNDFWGKAKRFSGAAVVTTKTVASRTATSAASSFSHGADFLKQKASSVTKSNSAQSTNEEEKEDIPAKCKDGDIFVEKESECKDEDGFMVKEDVEGSGSSSTPSATEDTTVRNDGSFVDRFRRASVSAYKATGPAVKSTASSIKETASTVYTRAVPVVTSAWQTTKEGSTLVYERTKEAVQKRRGSSAANRCDDLNSETAEVSGSVREDSVYSGDGSSTYGDNVDGGSSFEHRMDDIHEDTSETQRENFAGEDVSLSSQDKGSAVMESEKDSSDIEREENDVKKQEGDSQQETKQQEESDCSSGGINQNTKVSAEDLGNEETLEEDKSASEEIPMRDLSSPIDGNGSES